MVHHHYNKLKSKSKSTFGSIWGNIEKQTMILRNKRRLFSLFKEFGVDIVLHGHTHESKEYYRKNVRFLNAGAIIKNQNNVLKVNLFNLNKGRIDTTIQTVNIPKRLSEKERSSAKRQHFKLINAALII